VACTLDLIGDRWTLLVIRDLYAGKSHYQEIAASPEGIATNILAERLERLVDAKIVRTQPSTVRVGSVSYELTERGRALLGVLQALRDWGLEHIPGTQAMISVKSSDR
jgi:DNA-binding HxlR family transcriptional regulator